MWGSAPAFLLYFRARQQAGTGTDLFYPLFPLNCHNVNTFNALNLPELITNTPEEYESLAIELATNPGKLKAIKDKLANNLSTAPLYDTKLFAKNLESAYTQMYERHHKGLKPDHIYVE